MPLTERVDDSYHLATTAALDAERAYNQAGEASDPGSMAAAQVRAIVSLTEAVLSLRPSLEKLAEWLENHARAVDRRGGGS